MNDLSMLSLGFRSQAKVPIGKSTFLTRGPSAEYSDERKRIGNLQPLRASEEVIASSRKTSPYPVFFFSGLFFCVVFELLSEVFLDFFNVLVSVLPNDFFPFVEAI